jgi:peroxin-19
VIPAIVNPTKMKPHVDDGDDDLDDLDGELIQGVIFHRNPDAIYHTDVLDQFTSPPRKQPNTSDTPVSIPAATAPTNHVPPAPPPPTAAVTASFLQSGSGSGSDPVPQGEIPEADELTAKLAEDFVTELTKGMESLMREIGGDAGLPGSAVGEKTEEQEREFRAAWEAMLIQGMGTGGISGLDTTLGSTSDNEMGKDEGNVAGKEGFQQSIRQTMDKLKESESMLKVRFSTIITIFRTSRFDLSIVGGCKPYECGC